MSTYGSMYGANPEQLAALGRSLQQQVAVIDGVLHTVSAALDGTAWVGPARDRFANDWHTTFRAALGRLNEAFQAAGADCVRRSTELARVMGAA